VNIAGEQASHGSRSRHSVTDPRSDLVGCYGLGMFLEDAHLEVIGRIRTPFIEPTGTPIQPAFALGVEGQVVLGSGFSSALKDIEGFERLWLIYWLDRITTRRLQVVPYRDTQERGVFATRAPCRPNPIGMSSVRLLRRESDVLHVADVDILDGTPLLDIKPYVPEYDAHPLSKAGWVDSTTSSRRVADGRFHETGLLEPEK